MKTVLIALYLTASVEQVEDAGLNQGTWKKQKEQVAKLEKYEEKDKEPICSGGQQMCAPRV